MMATLKAMKSNLNRSYDKQNPTLVVISYEIYETRRSDHSCKILYFPTKKSSVRLLSDTLTSKRLVETDVKTSKRHIKRQNRHADVMHESRLISLM